MSHKIEFSPEALGDLIDLYPHRPARRCGTRDRLYRTPRGFLQQSVSISGPRRQEDDMRPALRILGFARRAVIAFQIAPGMVRILRIFYGGRDRETVFS